MKATKATVAKAAAISSKITAIAKSNSDLSLQAKKLNKILVLAITMPAKNIAFKTPDLITNNPPKSARKNLAFSYMLVLQQQERLILQYRHR